MKNDNKLSVHIQNLRAYDKPLSADEIRYLGARKVSLFKRFQAFCNTVYVIPFVIGFVLILEWVALWAAP